MAMCEVVAVWLCAPLLVWAVWLCVAMRGDAWLSVAMRGLVRDPLLPSVILCWAMMERGATLALLYPLSSTRPPRRVVVCRRVSSRMWGSSSPSYHRRHLPCSFLPGLPSNWVVATGYKACCSSTLTDNVDIVLDSVNGATKPVLALKANNMDNPSVCKPGKTCHEMVRR